MEFGKLPSVDHIRWAIPVADPHTKSYLQSHSTHAKTKIYFGGPAWGCRQWIGRLYPPGTSPNDFLFHYSRNFNCIELNTTHYQIPLKEKILGWVDKVPPGFLFCPKIPKVISHDPKGMQNHAKIEEWFKALENFGAHLGPCFLQLPPNYYDKQELFNFLKGWPVELDLAIEFRHPTWFENGRILPRLVEFLQSRKIGLVSTDVAGRRDVLHGSISAPFAMLRLIGNDLHSSDFTRATAWAEQIAQWQSWGLQKFFFMVHEPDDIKTPEMADWVVQELNRVCGAGLTPIAKPLI